MRPGYSLVLYFFLLTASSQAMIEDTCQQRLSRFYLWAGSAYVGGMATLAYVWYGNSGFDSFSFFNDIDQWRGMDKLGHAYTAFHLSERIDKALGYACLPPRRSRLQAALMGFLLMLPIEILDGFSPDYGFSWADVGANAAGSFLYWIQTGHHPWVRMKYSFFPTRYAAERPELLGHSITQQWLKDYNGQTYWLTLDLPRAWQHRLMLPIPLTLAIGYGAGDMLYARPEQNRQAGLSPYSRWYLSLDIDWAQISTHKRGLRWLFAALNLIKIPAPTLSWSPERGWKGYWIYF